MGISRMGVGLYIAMALILLSGRDHKGVGMAHEIISFLNLPRLIYDDGTILVNY